MSQAAQESLAKARSYKKCQFHEREAQAVNLRGDHEGLLRDTIAEGVGLRLDEDRHLVEGLDHHLADNDLLVVGATRVPAAGQTGDIGIVVDVFN